MNLDADRLAQLAGLPATNRRNLSEAANSSLRDEPALSDEQDHRFGKGQIAEEYGGNKGDKIRGRGEDKRGHRHGDKAYVQEMDHPSEGMHYEGEHKDADEAIHYEGEHEDKKKEGKHVVEIDEAMLAEEIARMRQERLQENELRGIIRAEIGSIIRDLKKESAGSGNKAKERANKMRGVTMGMTGPGFR